MQGDLCHVPGGYALVHKYGGDALVYKGEEVYDAVVTVDWEPKSWRCETYGENHAMYADIRPSWGTPAVHSRAQTIRLPFPDIVTADALTLTLSPAPAHCAAGEETSQSATFTVGIRQGDGAVANISLQFTLMFGEQRKTTIVQQDGRIIMAY